MLKFMLIAYAYLSKLKSSLLQLCNYYFSKLQSLFIIVLEISLNLNRLSNIKKGEIVGAIMPWKFQCVDSYLSLG